MISPERCKSLMRSMVARHLCYLKPTEIQVRQQEANWPTKHKKTSNEKSSCSLAASENELNPVPFRPFHWLQTYWEQKKAKFLFRPFSRPYAKSKY